MKITKSVVLFAFCLAVNNQPNIGIWPSKGTL